MRRTSLTIAILALVWIGYIAWPIYDLLVLIRAVETRDITTVTPRVYFDAVRISLTNQIVDLTRDAPESRLVPLRGASLPLASPSPIRLCKNLSRRKRSPSSSLLAGQ